MGGGGGGFLLIINISTSNATHTHTHTLTRWDVTISRHYMPAQLFIGSIIYRQQLVRLFLRLQTYCAISSNPDKIPIRHILVFEHYQACICICVCNRIWQYFISTMRHVLDICICVRIWQYFISTIRQIAAVALLPEIQTVFRFSISAAAVPPHVQIDII